MLASGYTQNTKNSRTIKIFELLWRTLEMLLISCEINPASLVNELCHYQFHRRCDVGNNENKIYVPVLTLSAQENTKNCKNN